MIHVVAGVIVQDERILLAQRAPNHSDFAYRWCSPGGKVEPGESAVAALARELREEIGCECKIGEIVATWWGSDIEIQFASATIVSGKPSPGDGIIGIGWFTWNDMSALGLTPGNEACYPQIVEYVRTR